MRNLNQALLSKWIWQWSTPQIKLWKTIMNALYGGQGNALRESFFFRNQLIITIRFCKCFITRSVGKGSNINFWDEDWGEGILKSRFQCLYSFAWYKNLTLEQVIQNRDTSLLFRHVSTLQAHNELMTLNQIVVLARAMVEDEAVDGAIWKPNANGIFTVRSAYFTMKNGPRLKTRSHGIWKLTVPLRFKIFGWLLLLRRILTADNLKRRG